MPRILVITANPPELEPLLLDAEVRNIRGALGEYTNFSVVHAGGARPADLIRGLQTEQPEILHFAGHGSGGKGHTRAIALAKDDGSAAVVTSHSLRTIFRNLPAVPRVIVLNACYSTEQAAALARYVDVVIGVRGEIEDTIARRFAASFYASLAFSSSVASAFELAAEELTMSGHDSRQVSLQPRKGVDPHEIIFYARPQIMARFIVSRDGHPKKRSSGEHKILVSMRGVDQNVDAVTYQVCYDEWTEPFWEVTRAEDSAFSTDDFASKGDVTLRATAWSKGLGIGVESRLSTALRQSYGDSPTKRIARAIQVIADN
jgi:hypothetical protein